MSEATSPPGSGGSRFRLPVLALALLTIVAGFADGYALIRYDVFVANQSGNIVRVGMGLVGNYSAWDLAVAAMLGFGVGAMIGWQLRSWAGERITLLVRGRLLAVATLIAAWAVVVVTANSSRSVGLASAFLGATAMGTMASVLTHVAGVQAQTTFQSATITRAAQGVLDWAARRDPAHRTGRTLALISAMTLACYAGGGAVGSVMAGLSAITLLLALLPLTVVFSLIRSDAP